MILDLLTLAAVILSVTLNATVLKRLEGLAKIMAKANEEALTIAKEQLKVLEKRNAMIGQIQANLEAKTEFVVKTNLQRRS